MKTVSVEFKKGGKQYLFYDNNLEVNVGDKVVVETERGQQFGTIVSVDNKDDNKDHSLILKIASLADEKQNKKNIKDAKNAIIKANELVNNLGLDMKLIDSYYTFDRKQLAAIYKTRIELRQVGVRDKAKEISGIGPCGRKLCCSLFLNDLDSVGIAQVKNQNLALNPSKINGLCGRLYCCLKYEDDLYSLYRKDLPEVGDTVKRDGVEGTVISLDIPRRKYVVVNSDNEKIEVTVPFKCNNERKEKKSRK